MIEYEVNISVSNDIAEEFQGWLSGHVKEMLQFDGFLDAECKKEIRKEVEGTVNITVAYHITSLEKLDDYFEHHAPRMRAESQELFPGKLKYHRHILEPFAL